MRRRPSILPVLVVALLASCSEHPAAEAPDVEPAPLAIADRIYLGGDVVTVDPEGRVDEALAIRDGEILAAGSRTQVLRHRGDATEVVDLAGRAVLPGFVDSHGHLTQVAQLAAAVNLAAPPVGSVGSIGELQAALRSHIQARGLPPGTWVVGTGYDDALLAERRHPGRSDLDAVSTEHPIALLHVSLHLAAANGPALEAAGVGADTPDPQGGVIRRLPGGAEPSGVLEESAAWMLFGALPKPSLEQRLALLRMAQQRYAAAGITTAQDGATSSADWELLQAAARRGELVLDVVAYPVWLELDAILGPELPVGAYRSHLKLGGVKLILDGSPQGKTAYLSEPYHVPPAGRPADYRGYPALPDPAVDRFVEGFYGRGLQVLAHANGDAAAEQLIGALERAHVAHGGGDRRPVVIHAQTLREDQLDRMLGLGAIPSFFGSHVFYWGDWHRDSVLGPERAARISPTASARRRGLRFTLHNDPPVVPPDILRLVWSAVNRVTRSGQVLGEAQRITVADAIRAVTIDGAHQYFEEERKGSLEPGKLADLVILSESPLRVDPMQLQDIQVVETLKEGETIYRAADSPGV